MSEQKYGKIKAQMGGSASEVANYVGYNKQLVIDEDNRRIHIMDGKTKGGTITPNMNDLEDTKENLKTDINEYQLPNSSFKRNFKNKLNDWVSLKDFGAIGDSITDDTEAINNSISYTENIISGLGKTYNISNSISLDNLKDFSFKKENLIYGTSDWFKDFSVKKISSLEAYTAWPQGKCYQLNGQLRVWAMTGKDHVDSENLQIVCFTSDDGGISWSSGTFLDTSLKGAVCYSAGVTSKKEYLFIKTSDEKFVQYSRNIPSLSGSYGDKNTWVKKTLTLPLPEWTEDTSVFMLHDFCEGTDGEILIGASFTEGCGIYVSDDEGESWIFHTIVQEQGQTEPTICCEGNVICGFTRAQNEGQSIIFWSSTDNLNSITLQKAPEYFWSSSRGLIKANISCVLYKGKVYFASAQRNGNVQETDSDVKSPLYFGICENTINFWENAKIYVVGYLSHLDAGGNSALGQTDIVLYSSKTIENSSSERAKLIIFYGDEERIGRHIDDDLNSITNIYALTIPITKGDGLIDRFQNKQFIENGSSLSGFCKDFSNRTYSPAGSFVIRRKQQLGYSEWLPNDALCIDGGDQGINVVIASRASSSPVQGYQVITNDNKRSGVMVATNGGGVRILNNGNYSLQCFSDSIRPTSTSSMSVGSPSYHFSQVYADTGTINTSDLRYKINISNPSEELIKAWNNVNFKIFQFINAIEKKGSDKARLHLGAIAQEVKSAFEAQGLNAFDYGLLCYDEWEDEYEDIEIIDQEEVLDEEGNIVTPRQSHIEKKKVLEAGNRYGLRYEECLVLEAVCQRARADKLENKLNETINTLNSFITEYKSNTSTIIEPVVTTESVQTTKTKASTTPLATIGI